jgi:phage tail-like protein
MKRASLAASLAILCLASVASAGDVRAYVAGNYFLELDGVKVGWLKSVEGGGVTAEVMKQTLGPSYFERKQLGAIKYEDITIQIGFSMSKAIYDWIAASWLMNYQRKNGAIVACDYKLDAKSRLEFFNALITEVSIPAADGASKNPGFITIKLAPEYTRVVKASGKVGGALTPAQQKVWLPSNFRVEIDGLDATKVTKIDAFTVKQQIVQKDPRDYLKEPGKLEIPNLKITLSQIAAQSWYDWHEDFVIKGNSFEDKEKSGQLVFLSPDLKSELLTIKFFNLGIFKLTDDKATATDQIPRVSADLYVERMELSLGKAIGTASGTAAASTAPTVPTRIVSPRKPLPPGVTLPVLRRPVLRPR